MKYGLQGLLPSYKKVENKVSEIDENEAFILAKNPYWHPEVKPHFFDPDKVEELCLIAFEAFATSTALYRQFVDEDEEDSSTVLTHPSLVDKHRNKAETRINSVLLTLAITYRTLEDSLEDDKRLKQFIDQTLTKHGQMLHWYGENEGKTSLREVCNKIIHATDIRHTYDDAFQAFNEKIWIMEGTIELKGIRQSTPWTVSFILPDFLEVILDISKSVESLNQEVL